ncbi:MAG TPA: hypothetical protein VMX17_15855 [Candidatus Glassbacteria bacterium]|nr:hypothetical protein [Candidatus Glassbacteria bacterium]
MKILTEKELREIDPEEFEEKDIKYLFSDNASANAPSYTGRAIFDYDQGFSIVDKYNTSFCLVGIHGRQYKGPYSKYTTKKKYEELLSICIDNLRTGNGSYIAGRLSNSSFFDPICSFA